MAFYVAMICSGTYTHILLFCVLPDVAVTTGFLSHVIGTNYVTRSIPSISFNNISQSRYNRASRVVEGGY